MCRGKRDVLFRMPVLRRSDEGPLMAVKKLVHLWQDGGCARSTKRAIDEVVLDVDENKCRALVQFGGELSGVAG